MSKQIITHLNFAKGFRGGERQTLLLIDELATRGFKQKVITRRRSQLADKLHNIVNLEVIQISKPYVFNFAVMKQSSIMHAHETKAAQCAYLINLIYKIPYIITRRVDNPIKNNFFNKNIYAKAKYTVVLSDAIKNELFKVSLKINVIKIASAFSNFSANDMQIKNIKQRFKNKFLIGNIGELDNSHKGQYYLIEAMKSIQKKYPKIHVILLGTGKDESNYKEQSKNLTNITFEGFVDNVGDYIKCFDIFVFPSLNEGLGSILFDVMQAEVPIIASNIGGIPDIIQNEKNGILIPIKNSKAIYKSIERLYMEVKLRTKLSSQAYKNIDNFSCDVMTDKYENIYKEIISCHTI
jgi:glycosyltransferase involved in cell wall biosynthesis